MTNFTPREDHVWSQKLPGVLCEDPALKHSLPCAVTLSYPRIPKLSLTPQSAFVIHANCTQCEEVCSHGRENICNVEEIHVTCQLCSDQPTPLKSAFLTTYGSVLSKKGISRVLKKQTQKSHTSFPDYHLKCFYYYQANGMSELVLIFLSLARKKIQYF